MKKICTKNNKGFVLLFAVTLAAILLSIALGVASISLKEVKFSTSGKDANDAFFAADTASECALFYDRLSTNSFPIAGPTVSPFSIICANTSVPVTYSGTSSAGLYSFTLAGLGSSGNGCAKVEVFKTSSGFSTSSTITSNGYNIGDATCSSTNSNRIERELQVTYSTGTPPPPAHFAVDTLGTLKNGLVDYWNLDEATGTRLDMTGANSLTDVHGVVSNTGKINSAARFVSASMQYLTHASDSFIQTGDVSFTFSAWVYLEGKANEMVVFGKDVNGSGSREYRLKYISSTDRFQFSVFRPTDTEIQVNANNFGAPALGTWNFVTVWHDAAADTLNISVNNGTPNSVATGGALQSPGIADFRIGSRQYAGLESYLDGRVDEVGFWKKVLTAQERTDLYNGGAGDNYIP